MTDWTHPVLFAPVEMPPLDHLVHDAWASSEESFGATHPGTFLILESTSSSASNALMLRTVNVAAVRPGQERAVLDVVPSRDVRMLEYMELLAVFEASSRRMLPERYRGLNTQEVQARLDVVRGLLGARVNVSAG